MMKRLIVVVVIAFFAIIEGAAQSDGVRRELAGITGIYVVVYISPILEPSVPAAAVKTDVELKLRMARIAVLTREEYFVDRDAAMLAVRVDAVKSQSDTMWALSYRVTCTQMASLPRDPSMFVSALSFEDGNVAISGSRYVAEVRGGIRDSIDSFLNLYLSANP